LESPLPYTVTVVNERASEAYSINDSGDVVGVDGDSNNSFSVTDELGTEIQPPRWSGMPFARGISNRINPGDPTSAYVVGHDSNFNPKAVRYAPGTA
jgi:hypothetical protein